MIKSEVKYSPAQPDFNFDRSELNVHQFSSVWIFCMERTALDFVCLFSNHFSGASSNQNRVKQLKDTVENWSTSIASHLAHGSYKISTSTASKVGGKAGLYVHSLIF